MKTITNAKWYKRVTSFLLDVFFVNFIRTFLLQLIIFSKKRMIVIKDFFSEFDEIFGRIDITRIKNHHVRFIVNSPVFIYFLWALFAVCICGIIYNFLCSVFLNSSTLGQKMLSLKVVDAKNGEKPSIFKLLIRSILVPLPMVLTFLLVLFQMLSFVNFHIYAPKRNLVVVSMINLTKITNPYLIAVVLIIFVLFWYDIYYITDGLIMSDILSGTRVISSKFLSLDVAENEKNKDFVYFGDKFLDGLEKINAYLFGKVKLSFLYIKDKIKGKFKTLDRGEDDNGKS